jgi:hypothetical protein
MGKIIEAAEQWLVDEKWKFRKAVETNHIECGVTHKNGNYQVHYFADENTQVFRVYVVTPSRVPEDRRIEVALLMTRLNYGRNIGNFELDLNDGEVRYKMSMDVEGSELTKPMVKNMTLAGVTALDRAFTRRS